MRSLFIALSMYSRIPVPRTEWTGAGMRYAMCFFPVVGVITGAVLYAAALLLRPLSGSIIFCTVMTVIPIIITGGIHLDGFLDTSDALASYGSTEKKLEILKDSHAGAFAIIAAAVYFSLSLGGWSIIRQEDIPVIALFFCVSRALSGISIVSFPLAKSTGLAASFSEAASKVKVRWTLIAWLVAVLVAAVFVNVVAAAAAAAAAAVSYAVYYYISMKNFGGITGDTAGWFLQVCELLVLLAVGAGGLLV